MLMAKRLLFASLFALTLLLPVCLHAAEMVVVGTEQVDERGVSISVEQQTIYVTGAAGQTLEVVSLTGRRVMTVKIESPAQRIELNNIPKGCYILKIGKVVRKVSIK